MRTVDLIAKKRDGQVLTTEEINWLVENYTNGVVADYQMSAMLMAIYINGMNEEEQLALTKAMVASGDQIDLSPIKGIKVDKHSTGGVGDTTTLILGPLVAALDIPVAKMSGRGLGHTGGTLDKLESIPGFHIEISKEQFFDLVNEHKIAIIGQSGNITPADKKIYALRDVTSTVSSIPLIASSIMSKKIASGSDAICLDVKVGDGAFMKDDQAASELAKTMVEIGKGAGRNTMAVLSDMSQPLGRAIGNGLEVKEAIETLKGEGPEDLTELVLTLGSQMVVLAEKAETLEEARELLIEQINNGHALEVFRQFVEHQGGDVSAVDHPEQMIQTKHVIELPAKTSGYVTRLAAENIGVAAMKLGAGRAKKEDPIDYAVGFILNKKVGDAVKEGESLVTIYSNQDDITEIESDLYDSIEIGDVSEKPTLIHQIIV
ncbi:pyrimidine-nucleoside phosphorylase [Atopobacter phocae]|uniref:pyrimidine-nucleoside phosphorylase n=1 Tax=Atopobacter phocae TaxID=136492 RepID=UPI0004714FBE|nr:pyrimidine-nucleoside phosphorylase [Atopobacter phocae]